MYVRLAFAVAAHLEPEILVVDEVLAVGDIGFQKKCLNKLSEVSGEGRTVLLVSHNLTAIRRLCTKGVLLQHGRVRKVGDIESVADAYIDDGEESLPVFSQPNDKEKGVTLTSVVVGGDEGTAKNTFGYNERIHFSIEYEVNFPVRQFQVWVGIRTVEESWVFNTADNDTEESEPDYRRIPGKYRAEFSVAERFLNAGRYYPVIGISHGPSRTIYDRVELPTFAISEVDVPEIGRPGVVAPLIPWKTYLSD